MVTIKNLISSLRQKLVDLMRSISKIGGPLGPFSPFVSAWKHRKLIYRLSAREIEARYKGTFLGLLWSVLVPLILLLTYTFVFSVVFNSRWDTKIDNKGHFALILFAGLIMFNIFSECVNRAPMLMLHNVMYIKKVVFPLEVLPWVSIVSSLFNAALSFLVLAVGYILVIGLPPTTIVLLPLVALPLLLLTLGVSLFLASVGVFIRDLGQIVGVFTMVLMFCSPLFYPLSAIPEDYRLLIQLSPLTMTIESVRSLLFWAEIPSFLWLTGYFLCAWVAAWLGFAWFMKTKKGFADVI